jgi:hypothetical protein
MFERYTEKARRTIFFARYEASQYGSPYIETEHLLLGLLREDKSVTSRFLRTHEVVESIRKQVEAHGVVREKISTSVDLPLSNEGKRILAYAAEEAERLSHKHIGTEHLFLGILREKDCFAAQLLNERGIHLKDVRARMQAEPVEEILPRFPKTAGIPAGFVWRKLVYNPASEMLIVEMRGSQGPHRLATRLFMRHRNSEAYEQIGQPAEDVSYGSPVTCEKLPIVVFNSFLWDKSGNANWAGLHIFDLKTMELTDCLEEGKLAIPEPHLRTWVIELISLSDDGRKIYLNIAIEKGTSTGAIVESHLASLDLDEKKIELLSILKDAHF